MLAEAPNNTFKVSSAIHEHDAPFPSIVAKSEFEKTWSHWNGFFVVFDRLVGNENLIVISVPAKEKVEDRILNEYVGAIDGAFWTKQHF